MAPINVDPYDNALQQAQYVKTPQSVRFKIKIGDHVCISKVKGIFDKGYEPNWSEEVFTVVEQKKTKPPMYKIRDYNRDIIDAAFYEPELQQIEQPDRYHVERVIKTRVLHNGKKQYLVKWLGYPASSNSLVDELESISGEMQLCKIYHLSKCVVIGHQMTLTHYQ